MSNCCKHMPAHQLRRGHKVAGTLRRISGLMMEMTAMETSLENLREQMEKEEDEEAGAAFSCSCIS